MFNNQSKTYLFIYLPQNSYKKLKQYTPFCVTVKGEQNDIKKHIISVSF